MNLFGTNPFSLSGRLTDNPATEGPTYPLVSACWVCGTLVPGDPMRSLRSCKNGHDEVRWSERLPGVAWMPPQGNPRTLFTACP